MEAAPFICLTCGELIIVMPHADNRSIIIPAHPDRAFPFTGCPASSTTTVTVCDGVRGVSPDPGTR